MSESILAQAPVAAQAPAVTPATTAPPVQGSVTPAATSTAPPSVSWRDSLPDDLKSEPSLQTIADVGMLAKGYVHSQKMIGADKIVIPSKHATPDEWKSVYSKLGLPESVDKYELDIEEGAPIAEDLVQKFIGVAHGANILPHQAQAVLNWHTEMVKEQNKTIDVTHEREKADSIKDLKEEWKMRYDEELNNAKIALRELSGDRYEKVVQEFDQKKIGDNAEVIRMLAKAGRVLKEAGVHGFDGLNVGRSKSDAQKDWSKLKSDDAYWNKKHPNHDNAKAEGARLFQEMFPARS